jgi:hypothetical protein
MKIKKPLIPGLVIILTLILSACGLKQSPSSSVLFEDDFSKTSSGWDSATGDDGMTDYVDGTYHIRVDTANFDLWANPGKSFSDTQTEVDATVVGGPEDNDFGLLCRYSDTDNYYFAIVASDGYFGFGKVVSGEQTLLGEDASLYTTDLVNSGSTLNHLRFDCTGSTLTLYINGTQAGSVEDSDLASGDVGLIAGTFDTAGVEIEFDNFNVIQP